VPAFYFVDQTGETYQVICRQGTKGKIRKEDCLTPARVDDPTCSGRLAIITARPLRAAVHENHNGNEIRDAHQTAILASLEKFDGEVIYVQTLFFVTVLGIGSFDKHFQEEREENEIWRKHWMTSSVTNDNLGKNVGLDTPLEDSAGKSNPTEDSPLTSHSNEPTEWILKGRKTDDDQKWCVD